MRLPKSVLATVSRLELAFYCRDPNTVFKYLTDLTMMIAGVDGFGLAAQDRKLPTA